MKKHKRKERNHKRKKRNHKRRKKKHRRRRRNHRRKKKNYKRKKKNHRRRKRNYRKKRRNHKRKKVYHRSKSKFEGCIVVVLLFDCLMSNFLFFYIAFDLLFLLLNLSYFLFWGFIIVVFIDGFLGNFFFMIIMPVQTRISFTNYSISIVLDFSRPFFQKFVQPNVYANGS